LSSEYISECYLAIEVKNNAKSGTGTMRNASEITNLSHTELVRQCLHAPGNHTKSDTVQQRMYCQISELNTLIDLIRMDATPELSAVVSSERVVTASVAVIKGTRETPQYAHNVDPNRSPGSTDWVDLTIQMWRTVFGRAADRDDDGPVVEAIESGAAFLLEEWSIHAFRNQICKYGLSSPDLCACDYNRTTDEISMIFDFAATALAKTRNRAGLQLGKQVQVICHRMTTRPDVKDFVAKEWDETYSTSFTGGAYIPRSQNICAAIGCESLESAESLCAGCKTQFYCSVACQKSYVCGKLIVL